MIKMIWAQTKDGIIGSDNNLPWNLPEELKYFRAATSGYPVVMGQTTFESIGKVLPNRKNIVLSLNPEWNHEKIYKMTFESVLELGKEMDIFIIGGKTIYELFFPYADELYITYIKQDYPGNVKILYNINDFIKISEKDHEDFVTTIWKRKAD